jgi:hypothetical protein
VGTFIRGDGTAPITSTAAPVARSSTTVRVRASVHCGLPTVKPKSAP